MHQRLTSSTHSSGQYELLRPSSRGFTLIELLVVLAIVALLLTLAVPRYFGQIESAKEVVLKDTLRTTRKVIEDFNGDKGRYPDSLEELVDQHYLRNLPIDPLTEANNTWRFVAAPSGFKGSVYDLKSGASGVAKDGTRYSEW